MSLAQHPLAELLPPLTAAELQTLAADIGANGLLDPITILDGKILDGRNRHAACYIAGVAPRTVAFDGPDPLAFVIAKNLARRHLSTSQRAIIAARLSGEPAQGRRSDLGSSAEVGRLDAAKLLNVSERSVRNAAKLIETSPEQVEKIESGADVTVDGALKQAKRREREDAGRVSRAVKETAARDEIAAATELPFELVIADLRDWRPEGVASIITDPPYVGDSIPLYEALRDFAVDVLPEGGPLVVMTWQAILPAVIRALDHPDLAYRWCICWRYANVENTADQKRRVFDCWKPVLVYHKGGMPADAPMIRDEIANKAGDKDFHEWGQSVDGFGRLVASFSQPGDIVCDPFLGGGTTAIAALSQTRRFVGADIDAQSVQVTSERLGLEVAA